MAGELIQKGLQWKVGFGSLSYTGYLPQAATWKRPADENDVLGTQGQTVSHVITNPRSELQIEFMIQSTGSIVPPEHGAYVSLTDPSGATVKYYCTEASVQFSSGISRLSLTLLREDSMAATYDA